MKVGCLVFGKFVGSEVSLTSEVLDYRARCTAPLTHTLKGSLEQFLRPQDYINGQGTLPYIQKEWPRPGVEYGVTNNNNKRK